MVILNITYYFYNKIWNNILNFLPTSNYKHKFEKLLRLVSLLIKTAEFFKSTTTLCCTKPNHTILYHILSHFATKKIK